MNNNITREIYFQEEFLGKLTNAAYQIVLKAGINKPFLEVELELWNSLRQVMKDMNRKKKNTNKNNFIQNNRRADLYIEK